MSASPEVSVILWDLDGTLLRSRGLARRSWRIAFERVTGCEMPLLADRPGSTARSLIDEYLLAAGLSVDHHIRFEFFAEFAGAYGELQQEQPEDCVAMPYAARVLDALATRSILQTVVTGNTKRVAAMKLRAAGLETRMGLDGGAFGDESPSRRVLVELAIGRIAELSGCDRPPPAFAVVGDAVDDIEAANAAGAVSIAVARGRTARDAIRRGGPRHIVSSLSEVVAILNPGGASSL